MEPIQLSGRQITGLAKISPRHAAEFKAIVNEVEKYGDKEIILNLADLDATNLWRREDEYYDLVSKPNLTVIVDEATAASLMTYSYVTDIKIRYETAELVIEPEVEDPKIDEYATEFVKVAKSTKNAILWELKATGRYDISTVGATSLGVSRTIERLCEKVVADPTKKGLAVDFSEINFEGGSDLAVGDTIIDCKKKHSIPIKILGNTSIKDYVHVQGNIKLNSKSKIQFYKYLEPGTVLKLSTYPSNIKSDVLGRKGSGNVIATKIVIYRGIEEVEGEWSVNFDEIPTQKLYLPDDLRLMNEEPVLCDTVLPRCRPLKDLGIHGLCSGTKGNLGPLTKSVTYNVNIGEELVEIDEIGFVLRGLENLGVEYNKELLELGRVLPVR